VTAPALGTSAYALLTDGSTVEIRHARPQDVDAVREMHAAMSPDNMYLRFFSPSRRMAEREARRVCREPGPDHEALLAWLGGRLVGVATYEDTGRPGVAEIAFAVPDDMHHRGIATLLLEHLVSLGRRRELRAFTAQTLAENAAMLQVFAHAGLPVRRRSADGVVELTFPLPGSVGQGLDSYLDSVARRESRADVASLRHLLRPVSVAVVGASRKPGTVGHAILRNIMSCGFQGSVYAVNPHATQTRTLEGARCVRSIADLPEPVDLAVIAVLPAAVPQMAAQCGRQGVRALTVITSGLGHEGADLLAICRRYGMRLVGPNCFGVSVPEIGLNATFAASHPAPGVAGLVVQSAGVGVALLEQLSRLGIGVSSFASVGDKYDVSSNDLLMWWAQDDVTQLAILYVESFGSPRKFARTARRVSHQMPVLTVVGGRSAAGPRATASSTAAVATRLLTQEALFGQAGVIAAASLGELTEAAALLAGQPLPSGPRVAIVTNAGGTGVLAADACGDNGLKVTQLAGSTRRRLRRLLPAGAVVTGPVDTTAAAGNDALRACLEEVAADEGVDAVLAVAMPTAISDLGMAIAGATVSKPMAAVLLGQAESVRMLAPGRPCYGFPEDAARALGHAARYRAWRDRPQGRVPELPGLRPAEARKLLAGFLARRPAGGWLPAGQAAELLASYQIPVVASRPARSEQEAAAAAAELGGRVVLKAEADGLGHESHAGAAKLDLRTPEEVAGAYHALEADLGPSLKRVLVQPMIADGVEVLIGVVQEPMFGPLVVFGLGGVATDVLGDHAARLTPLTDTDADELIHAVDAAPLLFGHRGAPPANVGALADTLLRVSRLADDLPEVAELDLNPVIARPDGVYAVDVRVRVSSAEPQDPFLRRLR
jgi:acyl-CoA synthetase (NDP forming)/RimJ/RimL family protein N-acetyltransferase